MRVGLSFCAGDGFLLFLFLISPCLMSTTHPHQHSPSHVFHPTTTPPRRTVYQVSLTRPTICLYLGTLVIVFATFLAMLRASLDEVGVRNAPLSHPVFFLDRPTAAHESTGSRHPTSKYSTRLVRHAACKFPCSQRLDLGNMFAIIEITIKSVYEVVVAVLVSQCDLFAAERMF